MKAIVVMNGQFYSGENARDNKLNFSPERSKAVVVDERRLRDITKSVFNWSLDGTIDLRRFEVLEVNGGAKDAKVWESILL